MARVGEGPFWLGRRGRARSLARERRAGAPNAMPGGSSAVRRLLLVWHSRTGHARAMADAMEAGALAVADEMELPLSICKRRAAEWVLALTA